MRYLPLICLFSLSGCSLSIGGLYMGTGSHPQVNFTAKTTVGPVEALLAPTTQRGVNDLYMVGLYPTIGNGIKATVGAGWAWWRDWGACDADGHNCAHNWTSSLTAGAGLTYTAGHARIDVRYQVFTDAPYDGALLFTAGVTP